ncbi:hypothetical protein ACFQ14_04385 [Pseudahrensia aquimaris]|uniref:Lipoprotein n=1 Tax=Pseudahrensia aquimaris TaxID=744461 RepID=A0ABW3FFB9_9HYPH
MQHISPILGRMNFRAIFPSVCLCAVLALSACTTTGTDALSLESVLPSTETPDQPGARKQGDYPNVNNVPQGQTSQMTTNEKAQIKRELAPAANRNPPAQQQAVTQGYKRDVSEMEKLLDYHEKRKAEPDYE